MRKQLFSTFIFMFALSGLTLSGTADARMKCWTNNEGVKECGNARSHQNTPNKAYQEIEQRRHWSGKQTKPGALKQTKN